MTVAFHDYSLTFKGTANSRRGSLLRFTFPFGYGYADCHPWTEFGDEALEIQKKKLRHGIFTDLTRQAFQFAKIDAQARSNDLSLIKPGFNIKSHFIIKDLLAKENEQAIWLSGNIVKIKLKGLDAEIKRLQRLSNEVPDLKWRLDFNANLTYIQFCSFLEKIDRSSIDFIEDPFPFDETLWQKVEDEYGVSLAADFEKKKINNWLPKVLVIKPAVDSLAKYSQVNARLVVTSYMAHPLEQVSAAYTASILKKVETMGLFSHCVYNSNSFSDCFTQDPGSFCTNLGAGFGFAHLLEELDWHD